MIATTKEQSARLLACGVSADTADMSYQFIDECVNDTDKPICSTPKEQFDTIRGYGFGVSRIHITPAWSLSALLTKVLPSDVDLRMLKLGTGAFNNPNAWSIMYSADLYTEHSDIVEACVLMAEKLVANGYKLNEQ